MNNCEITASSTVHQNHVIQSFNFRINTCHAATSSIIGVSICKFYKFRVFTHTVFLKKSFA